MKVLPVTESYHTLNAAEKDNRHQMKKLVIGLLTITAVVCFVGGISVGRSWWPREKIVEKPTIVEVFKKTSEEELLARAEERIQKELFDLLGGWSGVLEVKDGQAQTVRYKRAAIAKKGGFVDLENKKSYPIWGYMYYDGIGYGIIRGEDKTLFLLKWNSGKTKAPIVNPGAIMVPQGIIVQTTGQ